ncbi:MAG: hypothetical protein U0793_29360 [Gemmataceae bacterium]
MARARSNGSGKLEEAMRDLVNAQANLVKAQALLAQSQAAADRRFAEFEIRMNKIEQERAELERANAKRFERIEAILLEHNRILASLPDQVREKIGFKAPG